MRPRVFPAEDGRQPARTADQARLASMRPRVFPAEDVMSVESSPEVKTLQ